HGDRALELIHSVVQGKKIVIGMGIAISPGLVNEQEHPAGKGVIRSRHKAALAGRNVLALLQAETSNRSDSPNEPPLVPRQKRLGTILDDRDAIRAGQFHDWSHITGIAKQMRDYDGPRALAQAWRDGFRGYIARCRVHVGEDGDRPLIE